jgi:hypothetical protein
MTPARNARIAGFTFLLYIVAGIAGMMMHSRATGGVDVAAKLASITQHLLEMRMTIVLGLVQAVCALVLAVTLYAITRDEDSELALLALAFRVGEGLLAAIPIRNSLELLWLATATGPKSPDPVTLQVLGAYILKGPNSNTGAISFAIGSLLFSYLLLRGRMIPVLLAWLGVAASALLVIGLPLQLAGFISGSQASFLWIPMAAFEVPLGIWLLIKGVATTRPPRGRAANFA